MWPCDGVVRSMSAERALAPVVLRRGEFGRGRDLPSHRLAEIESACARHGMSRFQALSFRRQLLRAQPGGMRRVNQSNAMGSAAGQQQVADLFERAVEAHLLAAGAPFLTQAQQRAEVRAGTRARAPTPDILFRSPVLINGRAVRWLDCKLYYGAALLADNPKEGHLPKKQACSSPKRTPRPRTLLCSRR
jgi:hypothetical protein